MPFIGREHRIHEEVSDSGKGLDSTDGDADGRIREDWTYFDSAELLRQLEEAAA